MRLMKSLIPIALSFLFFILFLPALGRAATITYYVDSTCSTNGNGTSTTCGASGPWNSLANINWTTINSSITAGNPVNLLFNRAGSSTGQIYYGYMQPTGGGSSSAISINLGTYGVGAPPRIRTTALLAGSWTRGTISSGSWSAGGSGSVYSYSLATSPTFHDSALWGVWEDNAPLFNALNPSGTASLANMRPGTFFWSSNTLYVWTYEGDSPANHAVEASLGSSYPVLLIYYDHIHVSNLWLERSAYAGIEVYASLGGANISDVSFTNVIGIDNDVGYFGSGNGTYTSAVVMNNSDLVHNIFSAVALATGKNATLTVHNSILGNSIGPTPLVVQSTGVLNLSADDIVIGTPIGRYNLTVTSGGTINGAATNLNPQFVNAGASTGLSVSLLGMGREANGLTDQVKTLNGLKAVNPSFNMSSQIATQDITFEAGGTWANQASYAAAGGELCPTGRDHVAWATGAFGTDFTTILYLSETNPGSTYSFDGRYVTTANATNNLNLDTTNTNATCNGVGGFNLTVLGWPSGITGETQSGLVGCIEEYPDYAVGYVDPGPGYTSGGSIYAKGTYGAIASSILAVASNVSIYNNGTTGNVAFNLIGPGSLFNTEMWNPSSPFAAGLSWINDYNGNIGSAYQISTAPTCFMWPFSNWSQDEVGTILSTYGAMGVMTTLPSSNVPYAALNLYNQYFPGAIPSLFSREGSENFTIQVAADGTAEAENQAAWLSAWDASLLIFGENVVDIPVVATQAFAQGMNKYGFLVKNATYPMTQLLAAGAKYQTNLDSNTAFLSAKIVPVYNFQLRATSPALHGGIPVGVFYDIAGNPIRGLPPIGAYGDPNGMLALPVKSP